MIKTVLVADGAEASRERAAWCLRVQGYRVLTAGTGVDALAVMAADTVDLLILDANVTGPDACAVIREMQRDTRLLKVCVLLTADRAVRDDHDLAVLVRPFAPSRLVDMVYGMIGNPRVRSMTLSNTPAEPTLEDMGLALVTKDPGSDETT